MGNSGASMSSNARTLVIVGACFFFLGGPLIMLLMGPLVYGAIAYTAVNALIERPRISDGITSEDIAFGGSKKQILERANELKELTARPADDRYGNRQLSVAIVNLTTDRVEPRRGFGRATALKSHAKPVAINVGQAGAGSVLVITNRPAVWSAVNAKPGQIARIAIEGTSVFDVADMPRGLLAGFRSASLGAAYATDALDVERGAKRPQRARFCKAVLLWAKNLDVGFHDIRMWRFTDPDEISVAGDTLSSEGGTQSKPEYVSEYCRA